MRPNARAAVLVGLLATAGTAHFAAPKFFDAIVPKWMPGTPRTTTYVSGAAELVTAALVAHPRTRRAGGYAAATLFAAVFPANLQAALDGGMHFAPPPMNSATVAWLRLPLQIPMVTTALRVARDAAR